MNVLGALLGQERFNETCAELSRAAAADGFPNSYAPVRAYEFGWWAALGAVLPTLMAGAWDEGFDAMSDTMPGDYYPPAALGVRNPYRKAAK